MDTWQSMRVFAAVVEAGSFVAAAERLSLSPAMVTKHVRHLEDHLGVRLLHRTTRRLSLTEIGASYHGRCLAALESLAEADQAAMHLHVVPRGTLRVNAALSFGVRHLAPALAEYLAAFPEVRIDLTLNDRLVDLVEEGYDLAIRIGALAESRLIARRLAPVRLVVCGAPSYFQRHGIPKRPEDLVSHQCLGYSYWATEGRWRFPKAAGEGREVAVSGRLRANNGDVLRAAALSGLGIILQPTFLVGEDLKAKRLTAVLQDYPLAPLSLYAVYASRRHVPAKLRSFIDFAAARFGPEPPWDAV